MNQKIKRNPESNPMAWIAAGCLIASLGIALGAIGAHLLKKTLSSDQLTLWETGVRYQMYASFGMIAAGLATLSPRRRNIVNFTMLAGIILFSGCLYAYAFSGVKTFVHIVPLGGFSMIAAWLWLAWFQFRFRGQHDGEEV